MIDTKFTPGPWLVVGSIPEEGVDCFWIKAEPNPTTRGLTKVIATADGYQDDPEREANAYLIAAAPILYEALTRCKFDSLNMSFEDLKFIQLAMAQARGESA
jgi:hypothetical protein